MSEPTRPIVCDICEATDHNANWHRRFMGGEGPPLRASRQERTMSDDLPTEGFFASLKNPDRHNVHVSGVGAHCEDCDWSYMPGCGHNAERNSYEAAFRHEQGEVISVAKHERRMAALADRLDALEAVERRLALAERVCVLYGWSAAGSSTGTDRELASLQAWMEWADHVGPKFTGPTSHPDLTDAEIHRLAELRRAIRRDTLRGLFDALGDET